MSLVFCENILIRARSTSLSSFDSLEYSLQTNFLATSFSLGDVWNGVSTRVANSSMRDGFARCRTQVCGDGVQGDHSGSPSRFEGDPDVCSRIQSLDVMEITQKDYDNICVSSMNHPK